MDIERYRGDTYPDCFWITYKTSGLPVNLTGCSFKLTVASTMNPVDSSTQIYQVIGVAPNLTDGQIQFTPSLSQSNQVGYFYYDAVMTDGLGNTRTLAKGRYTYLQDITK